MVLYFYQGKTAQADRSGLKSAFHLGKCCPLLIHIGTPTTSASRGRTYHGISVARRTKVLKTVSCPQRGARPVRRRFCARTSGCWCEPTARNLTGPKGRESCKHMPALPRPAVLFVVHCSD